MVREFKVGSISASRCGIEVTGKVQSIEVMHSKERREKVSNENSQERESPQRRSDYSEGKEFKLTFSASETMRSISSLERRPLSY